VSYADAKARHQRRVAKHASKVKHQKIHARKVKLVGLTSVKRNAPTLGKSQKIGTKKSVRRRK
jgi:hypothetical protein